MLRNQGSVSKIFKTILSQKQRLSGEYGLPNDWQLSAVTVRFFLQDNFVASFNAFEFDMEDKRSIFQISLFFDCPESFKNWFSVGFYIISESYDLKKRGV